MARAKSIGSLFIDLEARTAKLEADMGKVKNIVNQGTNAVKDQGEEWAKLGKQNEKFVNQLTSRIAGAAALFSILKREIAYVSENIDRIPGIPATTVASVKEMKQNMSEFRVAADSVLASVMGGFADFGKALGASMAAEIATGGVPGMDAERQQMIEDGLKAQRDDLDKLAQQEDITYGEKVRAKVAQLAEEKKRLARAGQTEVEQIILLRQESERWMTFSKSNNFNSLVRTEAQITALQREIQAEEKMKTMREQLLEQEKRVTVSLDRRQVVGLSVNEQVTAYERKTFDLRQTIMALNAILEKDPQSPVYLKKKVDATKDLADAQEKLNAALQKQGELGRQVGRSIADNLGDAIMRGEGLHELLNQILGDILKIILQKSIIGPLGDFLGGALGGIFKFGSGKANGGPVGPGVRWVGENGPELLATGGYGTITPNHALKGGGGNTYVLNIPPGASDETVRRLEETMQRLAGPGVVERRAVGASINAKWRRGSVGANL
jgi:hypothetical protein